MTRVARRLRHSEKIEQGGSTDHLFATDKLFHRVAPRIAFLGASPAARFCQIAQPRHRCPLISRARRICHLPHGSSRASYKESKAALCRAVWTTRCIGDKAPDGS